VERRAHPLPAFGDRLVGQANQGERRQPRGHLHLDPDLDDFNPLEGDCIGARDHATILLVFDRAYYTGNYLVYYVGKVVIRQLPTGCR